MRLSLAFAFLTLLTYRNVGADVNEWGQESYPIDSSWAIQSNQLSTTHFGVDKQALHDNFMQKCHEAVKSDGMVCDDESRIKINSQQPMAMRVRTLSCCYSSLVLAPFHSRMVDLLVASLSKPRITHGWDSKRFVHHIMSIVHCESSGNKITNMKRTKRPDTVSIITSGMRHQP